LPGDTRPFRASAGQARCNRGTEAADGRQHVIAEHRSLTLDGAAEPRETLQAPRAERLGKPDFAKMFLPPIRRRCRTPTNQTVGHIDLR